MDKYDIKADAIEKLNPIGWITLESNFSFIFRNAGHPHNDAYLGKDWIPVVIPDSARYCEMCEKYGDHHTGRHIFGYGSSPSKMDPTFFAQKATAVSEQTSPTMKDPSNYEGSATAPGSF